ncbi:hypothetical protein DC487_11180 [Sphingobacterium corticibacter]|uniref:Magnesium citrate secondary transporter n=1 Tax=Sphingobacterium corticibacter TaxID=2171749 RepID=A0A2T8HH00_9SPHI|nr:hypothetical protein DC487_11180 [Sphingobacterium corticibacter]
MKKSIAHFLDPWFICFSLLFISHQILQWILGIQLTWIDSYLDPILMMPITLHIVLWERRYIVGRSSQYTLSKITLFHYFLLVSIIAEVIFPLLQPLFVADWADVLCYAIGTVFYYIFMNQQGVD